MSTTRRFVLAVLTLVSANAAQAQGPFTPEFGRAATVVQVLAAPPTAGSATWKEVRRDSSSVEFETSFTSPLSTPVPENNTVPLTLLLPAKASTGRYPVVFILHYLGAKDLRAERQLGRELNRRGIAAGLIALPYHLSRAPEGTRSGELAVQPDTAVLTSTMVQSVLDVRRALDILGQRADVDPKQFGVAGISLGSLVAELVFGIEPRFVRAGFLLGGTDLAHILWTSSRVIVSRAQLRSDGYTEARLRLELAPIEPGTYLRQRFVDSPTEKANVLAIGGRFDTVVPPSTFHRLVNSLQEPYVITINTGHYGGIFVQQRLVSEVARYFSDSAYSRPYIAPRNISAPTLRLVAQAVTRLGFDIGVGVDLFRTNATFETFGSAVATARGVEIFFGQAVGGGVAVGAIASTRGLAAGLFWSSVL